MVGEINDRTKELFESFMNHAIKYGFNQWSCNSYAPTMYYPIAEYLRNTDLPEYNIVFEELSDGHERFTVTTK